MESLAYIITADVLAVLAAVAAGAKFLYGQAARITRTEHRIQALEDAMAALQSKQAETDDAIGDLAIKVAVLETKVDALLDGQRAMMAILERLRNE